MTIVPEKKLDLFQNGNYVDSFSSLEEIKKYFEDEGLKFSDPTWYLNKRNYSMVESTHLKFQR